MQFFITKVRFWSAFPRLFFLGPFSGFYARGSAECINWRRIVSQKIRSTNIDKMPDKYCVIAITNHFLFKKLRWEL